MENSYLILFRNKQSYFLLSYKNRYGDKNEKNDVFHCDELDSWKIGLIEKLILLLYIHHIYRSLISTDFPLFVSFHGPFPRAKPIYFQMAHCLNSPTNVKTNSEAWHFNEKSQLPLSMLSVSFVSSILNTLWTMDTFIYSIVFLNRTIHHSI